MWNANIAAAFFFAVGTALILAGARVMRRRLGAQWWLRLACWSALTCTSVLAIVLIPLSAAGTEWPRGTPAHAVRHTVIISLGVAWLEVASLLAMVVSLRRQ